MHYVYHIEGKKIGATNSIPDRIYEQFGNDTEFTILFQDEDPVVVGDKEIELQLQIFGKRDASSHYADIRKRLQKLWNDSPEKMGAAAVKNIRTAWSNHRETMHRVAADNGRIGGLKVGMQSCIKEYECTMCHRKGKGPSFKHHHFDNCKNHKISNS